MRIYLAKIPNLAQNISHTLPLNLKDPYLHLRAWYGGDEYHGKLIRPDVSPSLVNGTEEKCWPAPRDTAGYADVFHRVEELDRELIQILSLTSLIVSSILSITGF